MNLAQCINPEWAQQGAKAWFTPVRPEGMEAAAPMVRREVVAEPGRQGPRVGVGRYSGERTRKVLRALADVEATGMGLLGADIAAIAALDKTTVQSVLGTLQTNGRVRKLAGRRPVRYAITDKGKVYLVAFG